MFYITDYITKMDLKTYETLSLLSCTVTSLPPDPKSPPRQRAQTLLHKCVLQFSHQQQIHAQQAARYLHGKGDSTASHGMVPMMSSLLLDFVKAHYNINVDEEATGAIAVEQTYLKIQTDQNGNLVSKNQVMDYWYRLEALAHMNFYDFSQCVALENKNKSRNATKGDTCLGTLTRHALHNDHPLTSTHHLVEHTNEERDECHS
jgi:hypothetical protein